MTAIEPFVVRLDAFDDFCFTAVEDELHFPSPELTAEIASTNTYEALEKLSALASAEARGTRELAPADSERLGELIDMLMVHHDGICWCANDAMEVEVAFLDATLADLPITGWVATGPRIDPTVVEDVELTVSHLFGLLSWRDGWQRLELSVHVPELDDPTPSFPVARIAVEFGDDCGGRSRLELVPLDRAHLDAISLLDDPDLVELAGRSPELYACALAVRENERCELNFAIVLEDPVADRLDLALDCLLASGFEQLGPAARRLAVRLVPDWTDQVADLVATANAVIDQPTEGPSLQLTLRALEAAPLAPAA